MSGMRKKNVALIAVSLFLLMSLAACNSETPPATTGVKGEPVLSDVLTVGCTNPMDFANDKTGLAVGTKAFNFTLQDIQGNDVRLSKLLADKPVVMVFGSFS